MSNNADKHYRRLESWVAPQQEKRLLKEQ